MTLPLLPNAPFSEGTPYTPELAYLAFNAPIFDGQTDYLGHREKLLDSELSDAPTAIKARVSAIENGLKVTVNSGLTLSVSSGIYQNSQGVVSSIPATNVVAPNNATSFVWVDDSLSVNVGSIPPTLRVLLARVVTSGGTVTQLTDLRDISIRRSSPLPAAVKVFGGSNLTDKVCTAGEVLDQGVYYFRDFTVPAGVTISVQRMARIFCSGNVTIAGTVNVLPMAIGGANGALSLPANITVLGQPGQGLGASGTAYPWGAQPYGSGGSAGNMYSDSASGAFNAPGGAGAGCFWVEAAGTISVTGTISAKGADGSIGGSSTVVQNGVIVYQFGVGGSRACITGSSAGSGGLVLLASLVSVTVSPGATIDVRGGNGGNGFVFPAGFTIGASGGYGGGGGYIVCMSPNNNTSGSNLLLSGGISGVPGGFISNVNSDTWVLPSGFIGANPGGGFGGATGGYTVTPNGSNWNFTRTPGTVGQLVLRNFVPNA